MEYETNSFTAYSCIQKAIFTRIGVSVLCNLKARMGLKGENMCQDNLLTPLKDSFRETSAVGFKQTVESKCRCQQIFWIFILILSFVGVFFHCYYLTAKFLSYPRMDVLSQEYLGNEFPFVTVCNNQPVSRVSFQRYINASDQSNIHLTTLCENSSDSKLFTTIGRELSEKIGHSFKNMILFCEYIKSKSCGKNMDKWKLHQTLESYNCYTFAPDQNDTGDIDGKEEKQFSLILY